MDNYDTITMYPSHMAIPVLSPTPDVIHIEDVANGLANICRYNGACRYHYSVAQHSVAVSRLSRLPLWGLLHDVPEYILGDVTRPFKRTVAMAEYRELEAGWMAAVVLRFGLAPTFEPSNVKATDRLLLVAEMNVLKRVNDRDYMLLDERTADDVPREWLEPITPEQARQLFLERYEELT